MSNRAARIFVRLATSLSLWLILIAGVLLGGLALVNSRQPKAQQTQRELIQQFEQNSREAAEDCAKSPGCDPSSRHDQVVDTTFKPATSVADSK